MPSFTIIAVLLAFTGGYFLGSIPFGLLLTRAFGLGDIRKIGSGNIGATNVLRTGNKGLAAATLVLDGLKGTVAVLALPSLVFWLVPLPRSDGPDIVAITWALVTLGAVSVLAGLGAFLGHLFPVWLKFKGGKGVATYIGVVFGVMWPVALVVCGAWLLVAWLTRYSSAASLVGAVITPPVMLVLSAPPGVAAVLAVMSGLLIWKHRENIARLRAGTESRIGQKG